MKKNNSTTILRMQELSSNVWPAKYFFHVNGWIIRVSEGITKRANSVLPNNYFGTQVDTDIQEVERIYQKFYLPTIFQIADEVNPQDLDKILEQSGYKKESKTIVLSSKTDELLLKFNSKERSNYIISNNSNFNDEWNKAYQKFINDSNEASKGKKAILSRLRIPFPFYFKIQKEKEGKILGTALGISYNSQMGIFKVAVDPNYRRKQFGTNLMRNMFKFAKKMNLVSIFLQVEEANKPALDLYIKLGFKKLYSYHYRIKT